MRASKWLVSYGWPVHGGRFILACHVAAIYTPSTEPLPIHLFTVVLPHNLPPLRLLFVHILLGFPLTTTNTSVWPACACYTPYKMTRYTVLLLLFTFFRTS